MKGDRLFRTRHIDGINRKTSAAIVKAQNELAIRKWQLKHEGKSLPTDPLVRSWRGELARLRDAPQGPVLEIAPNYFRFYRQCDSHGKSRRICLILIFHQNFM
ncbi:MAG: hypothetical protein VKL39_16385 [Leptolyngbyaceae bacterium]|nr:hypothetical protein [Leptolyngbyaceae bacterium]